MIIFRVHSNLQVLICLFAGFFSWHPLCMSLGVSSRNTVLRCTKVICMWRKCPFPFVSLLFLSASLLRCSISFLFEGDECLTGARPQGQSMNNASCSWIMNSAQRNSEMIRLAPLPSPPLLMSAQSLWLRLTQNTFPSQWRTEQRGVTLPLLICTQSPIVQCVGPGANNKTSDGVTYSFPSWSNQQLKWIRFGDYTECVYIIYKISWILA